MVMPMGSFGMNSMSSTGNVYQELHAKYGCGYIDYNERPKVAGYPLAMNPIAVEPPVQRSWLGRLIKKLYS